MVLLLGNLIYTMIITFYHNVYIHVPHDKLNYCVSTYYMYLNCRSVIIFSKYRSLTCENIYHYAALYSVIYACNHKIHQPVTQRLHMHLNLLALLKSVSLFSTYQVILLSTVLFGPYISCKIHNKNSLKNAYISHGEKFQLSLHKYARYMCKRIFKTTL